MNGSEKLDSSGLNLNWIKMLTRTQEYIPGARVLLDLGNVSVNRRIFINIYNIICTQTHIAVRVGTCRINYVFFYFFSSWRFRRNNNDVYLESRYTFALKTVYGNEGNWMVFSYSSTVFLFSFFSYARIDMYLFINIYIHTKYNVSEKSAFGWRLFMKGSHRCRHGKNKRKRKTSRISDCRRFFLYSTLLILMRTVTA